MTATISNVPGPQHSLSLCGVRITRISNVVTPFVWGLGVSIISYDGVINYGATSDNNVVERPERLTQLVDEAFISFLEPVASDHPAVLSLV